MNEISLCMIVKNEADNIRKSLESVTRLIDDIVVVDTGSTDATKTIAAEYTQAVFDFAWGNDFSQVRNFASSKARHDWILALDADEVVTEFDAEGVRSLIRQYQDCVGVIRLMNCFEAQGGLTTAVESISRLFNRTVFQYTGSIHEQLTRCDGGEASIRFPVPISVYHSGYRPEELARKGTIERNRRLLLTELEKSPLDPYWHYQAGKTYSLAMEFDQACENFYTALTLAPGRYTYFEDLVVSYGYALLRGSRYAEAVRIFDYYNDLQHSADYLFVAALVAMNNAQFETAIQLFQSCLAQPQSTVTGVNAFLPLYNIGVIYECLGDLHKARLHYAQCGDYLPAQKRLATLLQ